MHYRGKNAAEMLILQLLKYEEKTRVALADKQPLVKTPEDWASYKGTTQRQFPKIRWLKRNFWIPNLCTGFQTCVQGYIAASRTENACTEVGQQAAKQNKSGPNWRQYRLFFHNLKGFHVHHLMSVLGRQGTQVTCIPNNMEKYISFSVGGLRFIDGDGFFPKSLYYLAGCASQEELNVTAWLANKEEKLQLLSKKGMYPYENMADGKDSTSPSC